MLNILRDWLFDIYMDAPAGSLRERVSLNLMMFLNKFGPPVGSWWD